MPSRKTHALATAALASLVAPLAFAEPRAALVAAGALAGLLVGPDLDVSQRPYWSLYARTHRHRGFSHWPLFGTAERLLWLLGPPVGAALLAGFAVPWEAIGWWTLGLATADAVHVAMDWLS